MGKEKVKLVVEETPKEETIVAPVIEFTLAHADVYNRLGTKVRTYTKEAHGAKFADLAFGYAEKIGGSVRK